jgi:UDP-N-acetylglucosamine diphosphorylase/glucosamine-1-phosphate N-acetyltransferase
MTLVFVDDALARDFQPFAMTRPCCELRAGALLVRQRWEKATGEATIGFIGAPHLLDFDEAGAAQSVSGSIPAGTILVNSRCAVGLAELDLDATSWTCHGQLAAVRLAEATDHASIQRDGGRLESFDGHGQAVEIEGTWLDQVWDLVRHLPDLLSSDIPHVAEWTDQDPTSHLTTLGAHPVFIESGATIEPFVVLDATSGPVLVRQGAKVQSFTRLVGPCLIGEATTVSGGRVASSSIGEHCRVHGEVSVSVFTAYANKGHDGFIGHSVLGRWVNLGAGTVNSNLKNNYSDVALWTPRGVERTGMQFLGSFIGDHAKTAIGTRLTTGAVVGTGANVYGAGITPRYVPPFAWGLDESDVWELEAFLETAERAMKRRDVVLTEKARRQLAAAWERAVQDRR